MHRDWHGPTGIDYPRFEHMLRLTHCVRLPRSPRRRAELWADVHAVEQVALREWAAARSRAQR